METSQLLSPSMLGDSVLLSTIDGVDAALSTLLTYRLQLTADLDHRGLAKELGARDTVEFLELRHHRNAREIRRDLKTAKALPKYAAVTAALPNPHTPTDLADPDGAGAGALTEQEADGDGTEVQGPVVLNPGQADAIVWTLEKVPPTVPDDELRVAEEQMIEAARLLSPDGLLDFGREVLNRLDTDGPEPAEDDAHANESLSLRRADGGVKISGYLSGENAELLRTQINRLSKPRRTVDGELDPRPHPKRQADALTTLLNAAAATMPRKRTHNPSGTSGTPGTPGTSGTSGTPGTSDVAGMSGGSSGSGTSGGSGASGMSGGSGASDPFDGSGDWGDSGAADPFDDSDDWGSPGTSDAFDGSGDWSGFRASGASDGSGVSETPSASGACGTCGGSAGTGEVGGAAGGPGVPHITITIDLEDLRNATSQAVGELVYGDNLSASAVRRLACDAVVIPIVLGSDSQPLDVGMEQRYVTRAIRRALMRRDKGCVICKAPPWQCHAHHLIHWIDGGPTAIHNLALLCAAHHRAVHAGHWTITITRGVVQVTRPGWTNPGPTSPADLANLTNLTRYFGPPTTGPGGGDPHQEHPGRFFAPPSPRAKPQAGTGGLSWLTPEAVALLDPWGDSSTPSAGP